MLCVYWDRVIVNPPVPLAMGSKAALNLTFPPAWGVLLSVLSSLSALPVHYAPAGWTVTRTTSGSSTFVSQVAEVVKEPTMRWLVLASGIFRGTVLAALLLLLAGPRLVPVIPNARLAPFPINEAIWFLVGAVLGCVVAVIQPHPRRILGLVPTALTVLAALVAWGAAGRASERWLFFAIGVLTGGVTIALSAASQELLAPSLSASGGALADAITSSILVAALFFCIFQSGHEFLVTARLVVGCRSDRPGRHHRLVATYAREHGGAHGDCTIAGVSDSVLWPWRFLLPQAGGGARDCQPRLLP